MLHDRALTLAQFEPARYDDPAVRLFAEHKVAMRPDAVLSGVETAVEVELAGGRTLTARCVHPRGSLENPLSRAQVEDKFRTYAPERLSASAIDAIVEAIDRLEETGSARTLMDLLRQAPGDRTQSQAAE